jgi:hypothetical protein
MMPSAISTISARRRIALSTSAAHQLAGFGQVLGPLHEAEADPVRALLHCKGEVAAVLLRQSRNGHFGIGHVHALAIRDHSPNLGLALDAFGIGAHDLEADLAVVDQQPLALCHQAEQFRMGKLHARLVARRGIAIEREASTMPNERLPVLELTNAQFRTLQVCENGDRPRCALLNRPDRGNGLGMDCMVAVAHVDTKRVGTGAKQPLDHRSIATGGAEGGEDLDLAGAGLEFHGQRLWQRLMPD